MILLDTPAWIWFVEGNKTLKPAARRLIDQRISEGSAYLAAISVWEFAVMAAEKRIVTNVPSQQWAESAIHLSGLQLLPSSIDVSVESTQLPGEFQAAPADKMIVATARVHGLTLLTRDQKIISYSRSGFVQVKLC